MRDVTVGWGRVRDQEVVWHGIEGMELGRRLVGASGHQTGDWGVGLRAPEPRTRSLVLHQLAKMLLVSRSRPCAQPGSRHTSYATPFVPGWFQEPNLHARWTRAAQVGFQHHLRRESVVWVGATSAGVVAHDVGPRYWRADGVRVLTFAGGLLVSGRRSGGGSCSGECPLPPYLGCANDSTARMLAAGSGYS